MLLNNRLSCALALAAFTPFQILASGAPVETHPRLGVSATDVSTGATMTLLTRHQQYSWSERTTLDRDVFSPKSVNFSPDGTKYYVNMLEGCRTVVYDARTHAKLAVISHDITVGDSALWAPRTPLYAFRHYKERNVRVFGGRPVEGAFSHGGRYFWVPYYRRSFDINAQEPSAVAVIDTRVDSVVRILDVGTLPKMVAVSPWNDVVAIAHWGDNTVGLIDITDPRPQMWRQRANVVIDHRLSLNLPLNRKVDRDNGSGNALRGTVFTPQGRYVLVACMGGKGGIAVVDVHRECFVGRLTGMLSNIRHLVVANDCLYMSANRAGAVQRIPMSKVMDAIARMHGNDGKNGKGPHSVALDACDIKTLHLTGGIRTIAITTDGRYLLAASNTASCLHLVDARTLRKMLTIPSDSYPVGLDISPDGSVVVSTSQGRGHRGGNAVDVYTLSLPVR